MKTWKQIDPEHFDSVRAGQTVRVKWEDGPAVIEAEGYVTFVSGNFGDPVDLSHMVEDYRELRILHHHETFWYKIIGFMDVWVLEDETGTHGVVDAKRYIIDVLSRPENSEGMKHRDLWRSAWELSERRVSQRKIKAAIAEMVYSGEIRVAGGNGGTLHFLGGAGFSNE